MAFIDLETGIRIHYRDGGKGKPILFIPGYSATVDTWNYQVLHLHERYRIICIDPRGHGDSDKPYSEYTYEEMARDLQAFIKALNLEDVTCVGWSMGAGICLKYILDHNQDGRVTRVAMVAPATPCFKQTETEPFGLTDEQATASLELERCGAPEIRTGLFAQNFYRTDLEATKSWFVAMSLKMPVYVGYKYFKTLLGEDMRHRLKEVKIPVLICHGRHDEIAHPGWSEYMASHIPQCDLVWFENSGHALMVEEPDKLSQELAEFVS